MKFKRARYVVLGNLFRKYVFDLHGNSIKEFIGKDGRRYVPVVMPFSHKRKDFE